MRVVASALLASEYQSDLLRTFFSTPWLCHQNLGMLKKNKYWFEEKIVRIVARQTRSRINGELVAQKAMKWLWWMCYLFSQEEARRSRAAASIFPAINRLRADTIWHPAQTQFMTSLSHKCYIRPHNQKLNMVATKGGTLTISIAKSWRLMHWSVGLPLAAY